MNYKNFIKNFSIYENDLKTFLNLNKRIIAIFAFIIIFLIFIDKR